MCLQGAALIAGERAGGESSDGDAVEPVTEHEMLRQPVAGCEERLLDLLWREAELGGGLVDPQPVHLPQDVDAALSLRQGRKRLDERACCRPAMR